MKTLFTAALVSCLAFGATAAPKEKAPAKAAPAAAPVVSSAAPTSALFFATCAESMGSEDDFTKRMQALAKAKTAVKMEPEKVKGMVNENETQNAWAVKGFADPKKVLLLTYNKKDNICGMHASDVDPEQMRHAFQANLKEFVDMHKAKVNVYKPQQKGELTAYAADAAVESKTIQFGIAISKKTGEAFLTTRL